MKTNIFRVKEKKEKKIIIEEERTKNPILLFFRRYRGCLLLFLLSLLFVSFLASVGIAFSLFRGSNDYDVSYVSGSEQIDSNSDTELDDEDVKESLLGEIARAEGVVVLVETFLSNQGDVVSYYTDGTAIIVQANGSIYRVSPLSNGNYGVNRNGKISDSAKKILVTSTTNTLSDGTVITFYSDGTARVDLKEETIFVRDSNNIQLENGTGFAYTNPSGVALSKDINKVGDGTVKWFTDHTALIQQGNKKIIVNKNVPPTVGDSISYDKNNSFGVISEQKLDDGNIVTHYSNGAATITDKKGNVIYVKKAGDVVVKDNKLYEIITNPIGFSRGVVKCPDGKEVVYYDNGGAVIVYPNGDRKYVADNTEIIYDGSRNISSSPNTASKLEEKKTTNGDHVINFDNGKSQVIKPDGTSYIIDTVKLVFSSDGNITKESKDVDKNHEPKEAKDPEEQEEDPGAGIYISEAENTYNDTKNVEDTVFVIRNDNNKAKTLRITIIEVDNYLKFSTKRLEPKFVKFQATVGDEYVSARSLTSNVWKNSSNEVNYVIYDGVVGAKSSVTVAVSLYVDYAELTNEHQNSGFIGTINIYVDGKNKK